MLLYVTKTDVFTTLFPIRMLSKISYLCQQKQGEHTNKYTAASDTGRGYILEALWRAGVMSALPT